MHPQERAWLFVLVFLGVLAFTPTMPLWGLAVVTVIGIALLRGLLFTPVTIRFCAASQTMTVSYRLAGLFRKCSTHAFDELESIHSNLGMIGDGEPGVSLELILKNGKRLVLATGSADWSPTAPRSGYSGCVEPQDIATLRRQIASLTGVRNLGFS